MAKAACGYALKFALAKATSSGIQLVYKSSWTFSGSMVHNLLSAEKTCSWQAKALFYQLPYIDTSSINKNRFAIQRHKVI